MKYVFKIPAASAIDLTGMENWLEEMALKGLYLNSLPFDPVTLSQEASTPEAGRTWQSSEW